MSCITWLLQAQKDNAWLMTEEQIPNLAEDELEENKAFDRNYSSDEDDNDKEMEAPHKIDDNKHKIMVQQLFQSIVNLLVDRRRLVRQRARDCLLSILQLQKPGIIKQAR